MLYQVIVSAVLIATPASEPVQLQPQFEAVDEDEARSKLESWLTSCGYNMQGDPTFTPVEAKSAAAPRGRRSRTVSGPMGTDGVQLPTLDEYVAAGYHPEDYEKFIAARTKPLATAPVSTDSGANPPAATPDGKAKA